MNKTIIINMNGIVFHIEEDAYELLKAYITDIKRHFAYTPDSNEIVGDIESRIAEMFSEILAEEKKQVVVIKDVQAVTAQMGAVNDFAEAGETPFIEAGPQAQKKLFRDIDDRILGGVCAGIAHYFDIQTRTVRLIALLILLIGGSGLLIYTILWIVMPKAITRSDKMAMKGEPINIQNFKRSFDEEVEALHNTFIKSRNGAGPLASFFRNLFDALARVFGGLLKIAIKAAGAIIILFGTLTLFTLLISLFIFMGVGNSNVLDQFPFMAINPEYVSALCFSAFVLVVVPIAALILFAIRILFDRKVLTKTGSFAMLILWLTGLAVGAYYGSRLASEFAEIATLEQTIPLKPLSAYSLELNDAISLSREDSLEYGIGNNYPKGKLTYNRDNDGNIPRNLSLEIELSDVPQPTLIQELTSRGKNFKTALKFAQRITYQFAQKDSILRFDWGAQIPKGELWRCQEVRLKLLMPVNTKLYIDGRLNKYIKDYDLTDCIPDDRAHESVSEWVMTETGLKCKDYKLYERNRDR